MRQLLEWWESSGLKLSASKICLALKSQREKRETEQPVRKCFRVVLNVYLLVPLLCFSKAINPWTKSYKCKKTLINCFKYILCLVQHVEVPVPTPKKGEILLKLEAATINPVDWRIQKGKMRPFLPPKFPHIPGKFCFAWFSPKPLLIFMSFNW